MKALSAEILLLIFNRLHFKQKLECMLVCHAWANVLLEGYLFETIELSASSTLTKYDNYLRLLMKKAKTQPLIGNKCTRLLINNNTTGKVDAAALASSFPNLKFLDYQYDITYTPGSRRLRNVTLNSNPFEGWQMSLETLIDRYSDNGVVFDILSTGTFKNLTTLQTGEIYGHDHSISTEIVTALKNVPALTTLDILIIELSISLLEELHKNTPNLISLSLQYYSLIKQNDLDILNIQPAKKLKILQVSLLPLAMNVQDPYLEYTKLKYTCLEEFSYQYFHFYHPRYQSPTSDWSKIFSTLGSTLTKFTFCSNVNLTPILDLMSQHLNRLESLTLYSDKDQNSLNKVLKSGSFYNLLSLSLHNIGTTDLQLEVFENFTNLKEIDLHFGNSLSHLITLQDVIEKLPKSVETLGVEHVCIKILESTPLGHSSLINLQLCRSKVQDERISFFLDRYFPKLKSLVLDTCELRGSLDLPSHHLHYIEYNTQCRYFQITTEDKTHYFKVPVEKFSRYKYKRAVDSHDFGLQRVLKASGKIRYADYVELRCAKVDILSFGDFLLLL